MGSGWTRCSPTRRAARTSTAPSGSAWSPPCKRATVLVVKSIDRFGRNYEEIIDQWRAITKERGAEVVVLDMPLLDTRKGREGVTGRAHIRHRAPALELRGRRSNASPSTAGRAEGIAAARARGRAVRQAEEEAARPLQKHQGKLSRGAYHQVGGGGPPQGVHIYLRQVAARGQGGKRGAKATGKGVYPQVNRSFPVRQKVHLLTRPLSRTGRSGCTGRPWRRHFVGQNACGRGDPYTRSDLLWKEPSQKVYLFAHPRPGRERGHREGEGVGMTVAAASAARSAAHGGSLAAGLPMGRRTPRGRERWYLLRMPEGREATLCAELKRLLPGSVLSDAFVLRKERWMRRGGVWFLEPVNMYRGYAFAISSDAAGLAKAIAGLTLPVELVGYRHPLLGPARRRGRGLVRRSHGREPRHPQLHRRDRGRRAARAVLARSWARSRASPRLTGTAGAARCALGTGTPPSPSRRP